MAYKAGDLEVVVSGIDDNASASISTVIRRLNSLQKSLTAINQVGVTQSLSKIQQIFNGLSSSVSGINATNLSNLATAAKSLSSLTKLEKLSKLDWTKVSNGFEQLTKSITPFLNKINQAQTALTSLYGVLNKASGKKIQGIFNATSKNSFNNIFSIARLSGVYILARKIGSALGQIVQYGVDYTETLNLWQVAMQDNLEQAEEFVNKMNKAYGISVQTLMNAQAIFKNMLSGLGEITDSSAYIISEAITQMAVDYSSLYNIQLEDAFTKFQAALAGQVRPIRSIAGYDITENTLEQVYQALGGTKSIRNLTQTEKRLLSIYAIFQQMSESGALGDMTKTLDNFANQSRIMAESWKEMLTWIGISLQYLLQELDIMTYINAALMTAGDLFKAIAYSLGYVDPDFGITWEENIDGASDAVDDLTGKLLDFDKFRSLDSSSENILGIDETLLNAIAGYSSFIDEATNEARELANQWLKILGFTEDENGNLVITDESLAKIKTTVIGIGAGLAVIAGFAIVSGITKITKSIFTLNNALTLLKSALVIGIIYSIVQAVEAFKNGDYWAGILATTISVVLVGALLYMHKTMVAKIFTAIGQKFILLLTNATFATGSFTLAVTSLSLSLIALAAAGVGLSLLIANWGDMSTWQKIIGIIGVATTAILGLAMAFGAFHSAWSLGLAAAGITAGIAAIVASISTVKKEAESAIEYHALGASDIDGGTLFVAGEAGKTEAVYSGNNGKSNVANISQLKSAFYQALVEWSKSSGDSNINLTVNLDGEKVYQNTTAHAKRRGQTWSTTR